MKVKHVLDVFYYQFIITLKKHFPLEPILVQQSFNRPFSMIDMVGRMPNEVRNIKASIMDPIHPRIPTIDYSVQ